MHTPFSPVSVLASNSLSLYYYTDGGDDDNYYWPPLIASAQLYDRRGQPTVLSKVLNSPRRETGGRDNTVAAGVVPVISTPKKRTPTVTANPGQYCRRVLGYRTLCHVSGRHLSSFRRLDAIKRQLHFSSGASDTPPVVFSFYSAKQIRIEGKNKIQAVGYPSDLIPAKKKNVRIDTPHSVGRVTLEKP